MNVDYEDDVRTLMEHARRLLADRAVIGVTRKLLEGSGEDAAGALWRELAEQSWCGVTVDPEHGGLGMASEALCGLAEELGRVVAPVPFSASLGGFASAVSRHGSAAQQAHYLPGLAAGERVGVLALSDAAGAPFAHEPQVRMADGRLTGTVLPVNDGLWADYALVLAIAENGATLAIADLNAPGVTREPVATLDPSRRAARIVFAGAPAEALGATGEGTPLAIDVIERLAVPLAFEAIGGADACLEMARDYVKQRYAFGRPVGGYQAVKHKLADIYVQNEMARSTAYLAAWAADNDPAGFPAAAATARIAASEAYWFAAREAIQLHGGIGFTWEMDCHLHYRRALDLRTAIGAPDWWRDRLAQHLRKQAA